MPAAPLPDNERERLDALRRLLILDTPPEERFDRIVRFAVDEFDVPIALLSLVDAERQWFKSKLDPAGLVCGLQTPRGVAFCAHAILRAEPLVVEDARLDPRFADNPLVTGAPGIRFYAGAPLETAPGLRLGTLCVIDTVARGFDAVDAAILRALRDLAVEQLRAGETVVVADADALRGAA
ncbi:MAG TPA: GAF domain-containing protein [Burkholderiaceae bacterium]|nr:GAF domain-containing protein [Burkholderiaceae bacterium]